MNPLTDGRIHTRHRDSARISFIGLILTGVVVARIVAAISHFTPKTETDNLHAFHIYVTICVPTAFTLTP